MFCAIPYISVSAFSNALGVTAEDYCGPAASAHSEGAMHVNILKHGTLSKLFIHIKPQYVFAVLLMWKSSWRELRLMQTPMVGGLASLFSRLSRRK